MSQAEPTCSTYKSNLTSYLESPASTCNLDPRYIADDTSNVTVERSSFEYGIASKGGAISSTANSLTLASSDFSNNFARTQGGAVQTSGDTKVVNCTFFGNSLHTGTVTENCQTLKMWSEWANGWHGAVLNIYEAQGGRFVRG